MTSEIERLIYAHIDFDSGSKNFSIEVQELAQAITTYIDSVFEHVVYNALIGDNAQLKNLEDLYWSYVWEYVTDYDKSYDDLDYLKRNMELASPAKVGLHAILARADQHAKERIETLRDRYKQIKEK